jgi:hypothetical protein
MLRYQGRLQDRTKLRYGMEVTTEKKFAAMERT